MILLKGVELNGITTSKSWKRAVILHVSVAVTVERGMKYSPDVFDFLGSKHAILSRLKFLELHN